MKSEWMKTLPAILLAAAVFIAFRHFGRGTEPAPQPEETTVTTTQAEDTTETPEETTEEPATEATTETEETETETGTEEETAEEAAPVRQGLLPQASVRLQTEDGAEWILAVYEPSGQHPDVQLRLLKDGAVAQVLEDPGVSETIAQASFSSVRKVQQKDMNGDGIADLHILCEYLGTGTDNRDQILLQERIYTGGEDGTFTLEKDPSQDVVYSSWKEAYTAYIRSPFAEDYDGFSLISLNEDGLPELVAADTKGNGGMSVLFYREGRWVEKCFARTDLYYIEKENLLLESSGILDRYYDILYSISGGRFVIAAEGTYGLPEDTVDAPAAVPQDSGAEEAAAEKAEADKAEAEKTDKTEAEKTETAPDTSRYVYIWSGAEVSENGYRDGREFLFSMDRAKSCLDGLKDRESILKELSE